MKNRNHFQIRNTLNWGNVPGIGQESSNRYIIRDIYHGYYGINALRRISIGMYLFSEETVISVYIFEISRTCVLYVTQFGFVYYRQDSTLIRSPTVTTCDEK